VIPTVKIIHPSPIWEKTRKNKRALYIRLTKVGSHSILRGLSQSFQDVTYANKWDEFLCEHPCCTSAYESLNASLAYRNALGEKTWNECFKFSFVRNPYDRAVSSWAHLTQGGGVPEGIIEMGLQSASFADFWKRMSTINLTYPIGSVLYDESKGRDMVWWHLTPLYQHFVDVMPDDESDGKIILDFIGKLENLPHDFDFVCDKIGIPRESLPRLNRSRKRLLRDRSRKRLLRDPLTSLYAVMESRRVGAHHHFSEKLKKSYTDYYDDQTRQIVAKLYKKDIQYFGYKFGE